MKSRSVCSFVPKPHFFITAALVWTWALAVCPSSHVLAQPVIQQITDLNPGTNGSFASNLTVYASSLYFSAYTVETGRELWKYDGRVITLVSNINDTVRDIGFGTIVGNDSDPYGFTVYSNALYFTAFDPRKGGELWRCDGTVASRAADINPDPNDTIKVDPANSWPNGLKVFGDELYFSANGGMLTNYELWRYDGVAATLADNIHPDIGPDFSSYPQGFTAFGDALFFQADDGAHGFELWKRTRNASTLQDINPGGSGSNSHPKYFTPLGNWLYFQAYHDSYGYELWRTDGTNVSLVADINPGVNSSYPEHLTIYNGALYFSADDGVNGNELWKYDGVTAAMVTNINAVGDSFPKNLTVFGNQLVFAADDGIHGWELWKYDGTTAAMVADLNPEGDSFPESLTVFNNELYFVATTPATGYELWKYDGSKVSQVSDINPGAASSYPMNLAVFGQELVFSATDDGLSNWELWSLKIATIPSSPVTISNPTMQGGDFLFSFNSAVQHTYDIEYSEALESGNWQLLTSVTGTGGQITVTNSSPGSVQRFYRVQTK
jgi:ELWxxDGT repeat protein